MPFAIFGGSASSSSSFFITCVTSVRSRRCFRGSKLEGRHVRAFTCQRRYKALAVHESLDLVIASVSLVSESLVRSFFSFFFQAATSSPTQTGHLGESFVRAISRDSRTSYDQMAINADCYWEWIIARVWHLSCVYYFCQYNTVFSFQS